MFNIQFKDQTLFSATLNLKSHKFNPKVSELDEDKLKKKNDKLKIKVGKKIKVLAKEGQKRVESTKKRQNNAMSVIESIDVPFQTQTFGAQEMPRQL